MVTLPVATGTLAPGTCVGGQDAAPGQPPGGQEVGADDPLPPHHHHHHLHHHLILSTITIPFDLVILN